MLCIRRILEIAGVGRCRSVGKSKKAEGIATSAKSNGAQLKLAATKANQKRVKDEPKTSQTRVNDESTTSQRRIQLESKAGRSERRPYPENRGVLEYD